MLRTSVHGHEVIQMLMDMPGPCSRENLLAKINQRFGREALFHTCSASQLTAEQLVYFLEVRGKFVPASGGITVDKESLCPDMKAGEH